MEGGGAVWHGHDQKCKKNPCLAAMGVHMSADLDLSSA